MKKKQKTVVFVAVVTLILSIGAYFCFLKNYHSDKCTNKDREISNCVPAGKCGPTPQIDASIDCDVKSYDKKYKSDI